MAPLKKDPDNGTRLILDKECKDFVLYQIELKKYIDKKSKLEDDLQQVYDIIYGQCSPTLKQKLV